MGEPEKKQKLFYKIGEVSRLTGLESYVLRFWETEFPDLHPRKNTGRQRLYTDKDIEVVFKIKKMLYVEGLTIPGARKRLSSRIEGKALIERVRKELRGVLTLLQSSEKGNGSLPR
jgi:DNA-binding transcriptional MerR regulator